MRSRIFSSKYIKTISKGQIWIPAFIALGFLLAFPVTGMVKLSSWSELQYSASQSQILYNNLWKDGFVLSGLIIASIAAFINSVNGFIYLYSAKMTVHRLQESDSAQYHTGTFHPDTEYPSAYFPSH